VKKTVIMSYKIYTQN